MPGAHEDTSGLAPRFFILAVQDTTSVNYDSQQKMEGNGYISDKIMGVNIPSCLAVTPEGLVLGVLEQMGFNRTERKNTALTPGTAAEPADRGKGEQPVA
jgi:hypothetical protein